MANQAVLTTLIGGAVAASSLALLARRRRRARKNPAGIADANLSDEERRQTAEKLSSGWGQRRPAEDSP